MILGQSILGQSILQGGGFNSVISNPDIDLEIIFYSTTGEFVGSIGTNYPDCILVECKMNWEKYGGIKSMEITTAGAITGIPLYYLQKVLVRINGVDWFVGELDYIPVQDDDEIKKRYTILGYSRYLEKINVNVEKPDGRNIESWATVAEQICVILQANSPILYGVGYSVIFEYPPPNMSSIIKWEDVTIKEVLKNICDIMDNLTGDSRHYYYIDPLGYIIITYYKIESLKAAFFEGYDFNEISNEFNSDEIVNKIIVYRNVIADSSLDEETKTEFVATYTDTDSIDLYGTYTEKLLIPYYMANDHIESIVENIFSYRGAPIQKLSIKNVLIQKNYFVAGFYRINGKINNYTHIIDECNSTDFWTGDDLTPATLLVSDDYVLTGKKALKMIFTSSATYFEKDYSDTDSSLETNFDYRKTFNPKTLSLYFWWYDIFYDIDFEIYDEDGNVATHNLPSAYYNASIANGYWNKIEIDVSSLKNVMRVKILTSNAIMYIDRIEVVCNNWNVNDVELKNVEYIITGTKKIANMEYSSNQLDVVKDLQELSDRLNETRNVFFKGST